MLMGNITRDIEVKFTPKGTAVADIGMAINRVIPADNGGEKKEETTFVDVTLWGRTAEIVQQYCHKGSPLFIEGRLQYDTWEDKQSGQKRSRIRVVAEGIQLLGARGTAGGEGGGGMSSTRPQSQPQRTSAPSRAAEPEPPPFTDDDIPF